MLRTLTSLLLLAALPVHAPRPVRPADLPVPIVTVGQPGVGVLVSWTAAKSYDDYSVEYSLLYPGETRYHTAFVDVAGGPGGSMQGSYTISPLPPPNTQVLVQVTGIDYLPGGMDSSPPSAVATYTVIGILTNPKPQRAGLSRPKHP